MPLRFVLSSFLTKSSGLRALFGLPAVFARTACIGLFFGCIAGAQALPAGWTAADVGSPGASGESSYAAGSWTVSGGGADIWGSSDSFHFASREINGDVSIVVRLDSMESPGSYAKSGIMLRSGLRADAAYAFVFATSSYIGFDCRQSTGASSYNVGTVSGTVPRWLKLTRVGRRYTGYYSDDGVDWTMLGSPQELVLPVAARAGLAVDANDAGTGTNTSVFSELSVSALTTSRVNIAKYQSMSADSESAGYGASRAVDGYVRNSSAWKSGSGSGHWLMVSLSRAMALGSIQLYLGEDDQDPISDFWVQYYDGANWTVIPGANFTGNTATVLNIVLPTAVTATNVMLVTSDSEATVREIALYPPNGGDGYPLGADVVLNAAYKKTADASAWDAPYYPIRAVDGYVSDTEGWQSLSGDQQSLEVDLWESQRIGSVHLYSDTSNDIAIPDFTLAYWDAATETWVNIPGGSVSNNAEKALAVVFDTPVTTSKLRITPTPGYAQKVRELVVFPATAPGNDFPLWTSVTPGEPPSTQWNDLGDAFYNLFNRENAGTLAVDGTEVIEALPRSTEYEQQFQVLYNLDSDSFRIRNRDTGLCLEAEDAGTEPGTAVVAGEYNGQPHQLWRIVDAGDGYGYYVNVWNGLALTTDLGSPAAITLEEPTSLWQQHWELSYVIHYPKKGAGDYGWDWDKMNINWSYNWGLDPYGSLPETVAFSPQQWGSADIAGLRTRYTTWHTDARSRYLLGFNEPDFPYEDEEGNHVGGSDVAVAAAIEFWPQLEAADLPLVSPATAYAYNGWLADFYTDAAAHGLRVDYTGVHWYGPPDADGLFGYLSGIYSTWGKPVILSEFNTIDWDGSTTWSEEDNYRFYAEFLWMAESFDWLKRYGVFALYVDPPENPWDQTAPMGALFTVDREYTATGDLYAGWDGDRTIRKTSPYLLHNKGASMHLGHNGTTVAIDTIRNSASDMQWILVPSADNPYIVYIVSITDGRRLRVNGSSLDLAPPTTTGSTVQWTYTADDSGYGYFYLDNLGAGQRLKLNRTNDASGAPTGIWLSLEDSSSTDDNVKWRFIKPATPVAQENLSELFGDLWRSDDIGRPTQSGYAYFDAGTGVWIVGGGGADILGEVDQFHYVSQDFSGDGELIVQVESVQNTDTYSKAGLMFRNSTAVDAPYAHVFVGPGTVGFEFRTLAGGDTLAAAYVGQTAPKWLRLVRRGDSFTAFYGEDGENWSQLGSSQTIAMSTVARAGLSVTAHNNSHLIVNTSTFSHLSFLPTGWQSCDVGETGASGWVSGGDTFTLVAAGSDIWGTADSFRSVHQVLTGNGVIVARLTSVSDADPWAKAGLMIRQSLDSGSANAAILITPDNGVQFQSRSSAGSATTSQSASATAPKWLKLERVGESLSGYVSDDGASWSLVGTATVSLSSPFYVGLAGSSHDSTNADAASFTNVSLEMEGFVAYQHSYFNSAELLDTTISGITGDANQDGVLNLQAYAAGLSPWETATWSNGGQPTMHFEDGTYLALRYTRMKSVTDLDYTVKVGPDLSQWDSGPEHTTQVSVTSLDSDREAVVVRDNTPVDQAARRFMMLEIDYLAP
ncbi:glycosyl hydrolase [Coraliomargarita parva]|uniref:glycosyl hydrolase n=1 Tax=Coraliomargarita parva TaxID=3014050 RepID=UPI0022B2B5FC|nr:glycosyl hydrolase [Coraliomargarita parva]